MVVGFAPNLAAALAIAFAAGVACRVESFNCQSDAQCGAAGTCSDDGYCAFPDDACASGLRYGELSGPLAGQCVPAGETDAPPSTTSGDADPSSESGSTTSSTSPLGDTTSAPTSDDVSTSSGSVATVSSTGEPVDPSLVLWLDFDGDGADWLADRSSYGNHGSCGTACPSATKGVLGDAASFDGMAFVVIAHDTSLATPYGFTLAAWHRLDGVPAEHRAILTKTVGVDVYNSWELLYFPSTCPDCPFFAMAFDTANVAVIAESSPPEQWIHLAATWNGETMALFVDGQLAGEQPLAGLVMDEHPILIGADDDNPPDGYQGFFVGAIDDVRIYDRALDEGEIVELAQLQ